MTLEFCCIDMAGLIMRGPRLHPLFDRDGTMHLTIVTEGFCTPVNFCPSCGKPLHMTILKDREVRK